MKKIIAIFLFIIFFTTNVFSEIFSKITINGNKRISDETIKVYGNIKPLGSNLSSSELDQILKDLYETNFFKNVSVKIQNNILIIDLEEYPIINQLVILGEQANKIKKQIKDQISSKENNSFIENNINNDITKIKQLYSSIGYNYAKIDVKIKNIDKENVDLIFEIDRGNLTKISKISFSGDKKIKEKRLKDVIASEEDKFWKVISRNTRFSENLVELDKRLLRNYYKSLGYYDVKITSSSAEVLDQENINLVYTINAGQRYVINKISTEVDPVFDKNIFYPLQKSYEKVSGEFYSPFKVKNLLDDIDELIARNNLQFVEHSVQELIEGDNISLVFKISEGPKISVERINIIGNNITNESVVRSELILDEGDPYTKLKLDKSIANIKARNIFGKVTPKVRNGSAKDLKIIDIFVEEKSTGEISAGAGVGTDGGTVAFSIKENNWLGEGKRVSLDFEANENSVKGELSYVNPNYDLLGNALRFNLTNITNDQPDQGYENKILGLGMSTSFEQYKDIYTNIGLNATYDDLRTTGGASSSLKKQAGEFTELTTDYGFSLDRRNRSFMPTDGFISGFNQSIPLYADKPFVSNTLTSSIYHSFSENIVGASKIYLSTINGLNDEDVRLSKRRYLSSKRLRGFQRGKVGPLDGADHIGGNYAAAINFEANLPNILPESSNTDVGLFLDFGNVWGVDYDSTINESNEIRSSTGIAASWISPLGPMTFTFSTNLSKASTDETESFNFNLGTSF